MESNVRDTTRQTIITINLGYFLPLIGSDLTVVIFRQVLADHMYDPENGSRRSPGWYFEIEYHHPIPDRCCCYADDSDYNGACVVCESLCDPDWYYSGKGGDTFVRCMSTLFRVFPGLDQIRRSAFNGGNDILNKW